MAQVSMSSYVAKYIHPLDNISKHWPADVHKSKLETGV